MFTQQPVSAPGTLAANNALLRIQQLSTSFEQASQGTAGAPDYIARSGFLFAEFSAAEMRLSLLTADHRIDVVSLRLQDANAHAAVTASERLPNQSNYMLGTDPTVWRTHVAQFRRITYREIYPGIDLTYYGAASRMEHDFTVHEGALPSSQV